jgi:ubiquinone/menaquinone biosynthesis C-methylase UbiE
MKRWRRRLFLLLAPLVIVAGLIARSEWNGSAAQRSQRLVEVLGIEPGMNVAEVGAGSGDMSIALARQLASRGLMYATEVESSKLSAIGEAARKQNVRNLTVIRGGERDANLPERCCDAIFLHRVYHHIDYPQEFAGSLFRATSPGGRVAIIDFEPFRWRFWLPPAGNRGAHGVSPSAVIEEMTRAGFHWEKTIPQWAGHRDYCVVFRRAQ